MTSADTRTALLDAAQSQVQLRGYHAFSYRDLAEEVGIRAASIHHYFPHKHELAEALVARYRQDFTALLGEMARGNKSARQLVAGYADLFSKTFADGGRWCLCASLAADAETFEEPLRQAVRGFFDDQEEWLMGVIKAGVAAGNLRAAGSPRVMARGILSTLEGALLSARAQGHPAPLRDASTWILKTLTP